MNPESQSPPSPHEHFQRLLDTARQVQGRLIFIPTVAVGGTAAWAMMKLGYVNCGVRNLWTLWKETASVSPASRR